MNNPPYYVNILGEVGRECQTLRGASEGGSELSPLKPERFQTLFCNFENDLLFLSLIMLIL